MHNVASELQIEQLAIVSAHSLQTDPDIYSPPLQTYTQLILSIAK